MRIISIALIAASMFSIVACSAYKNTLEVLESYKALESSKNAPSVQETTGDYSIKAKQYLAAAGKGDSKAMLNLGVLYQKGLGVPRDYVEATRWYMQAARNGEVWAMTNLGNMYENGLGIPASNDAAIKWYVMAAERGDPFAMDNLGNMRSAGRGFQRDYVEAASWYRKAAERGFTISMGKLARMYHDGTGVPRSDEQAYAWAALAMERSQSKVERDKYLPIAVHMAQELDEKGFERAKQLKDELAKAVPVYSE